MAKYITFDTANDGNVHLAVDDILYAETTSSTAGTIFLKGGSHKFTVTGTGLTSGFGQNVNAAIVAANQSKWTEVTHAVSKDTGLVFTSVAVATI